MSELASETKIPLTIGPRAAARLTKMLAERPGGALRVSVNGGGCSGFQYAFDLDSAPSPDDFIAIRDGAKVLVDPISAEMLMGSELDFVDDLIGQSFKVVNPNAKSSCGCGVSFSL